MTDPDTRTVERTLRIAARPETVWRFWTDPGRMSEWWGPADLDPRPGGVCRVEMGGAAAMEGEFLELVPYERIVFSLGWEPVGPDGGTAVPAGSTRVEVTLRADGGDTVLTLRHTRIPAGHDEEHRAGWAHFLPRMAELAVAVTG